MLNVMFDRIHTGAEVWRLMWKETRLETQRTARTASRDQVLRTGALVGAEERDELQVTIGLLARGTGAMTLPIRERASGAQLRGEIVAHVSCVLGTARHLREAKQPTQVGSLILLPINGTNATEKVAFLPLGNTEIGQIARGQFPGFLSLPCFQQRPKNLPKRREGEAECGFRS